ncbi:MAG: lipocalin-like domain-containing protein [Bryobacteraceae bacterium]
MRISAALIAVFALASQLTGAAPAYRTAQPGYRYAFPADHFNHPEFQTEWWYYTGNLRASDGHRFGYELTFFRQGINREQKPASVWAVQDVWMAHLALSDLDGATFLHTERLNRSGAGIAGADAQLARVWNGNWQAQWKLDANTSAGFASQELQAIAERFSFQLSMKSNKPPVIHGKDGVSQKAEGAGRASHYISFTRLLTSGTLTLDGKRYTVEGQSWMDHEFFTHQLDANQTGWDWFSLQFSDGSELMLFDLRRKDGKIDPFSAGTYIDSQGRSSRVDAKAFTATPGKTWTSPATQGRYPVEWQISVPSLGLNVSLSTPLVQQELTGKTRSAPSYWEGAIGIRGTKSGQPIEGRGYLEMTGYAGPVLMSE